MNKFGKMVNGAVLGR